MLGPVLVRGNPSRRDVATRGALACPALTRLLPDPDLWHGNGV